MGWKKLSGSENNYLWDTIGMSYNRIGLMDNPLYYDFEFISSMQEEPFVNAVYRWLDDNCVVIVSGMDSLKRFDESELSKLGSKEYSHIISLSEKAIQDPSVDFVSVVTDGWYAGLKLLVAHGEVYRWLATDADPPIEEPSDRRKVHYLVKHLPELNDFVAKAMRGSKNITVWG